MYGVSHPATGLNLVGIEPPEFKFLFEQWAAYVRRIVQFARPVVIEDLREDARMSVEKIFVEDRVVIDERFRQSRQSGGRYLFQRRLICLESDASHVQNDPIFSVHGHGLSLICCFPIVNVQKNNHFISWFRVYSAIDKHTTNDLSTVLFNRKNNCKLVRFLSTPRPVFALPVSKEFFSFF